MLCCPFKQIIVSRRSLDMPMKGVEKRWVGATSSLMTYWDSLQERGTRCSCDDVREIDLVVIIHKV